MNQKHRLTYYTLLLLVFLLPIHFKVVSIFIILFVLLSLLNIQFSLKQIISRLDFKHIVFIIFYLLHVIGVLYTSNKSDGFFDLQTKLSFIILPVAFAGFYYQQFELDKILKTFMLGTLVAVLICFFHVFNLLLQNGGATRFLFGNHFAFHMHMGYFSIYLIFSWCITIYYLFIDKMPAKGFSYFLLWSSLIILPIAVVFISSRNGVILLFVVSTTYLIRFIVINKLYLRGFISFILFLCGFYLLVNSSDYTRVKFENTYKAIKAEKKDIDKTSKLASVLRQFVWNSSWEIFTIHPLIGVGTGDVKDELLKTYQKNGYSYALEKKLNSHNQYLQTMVALGIIGIGWLLVLFVYFFIYSIKRRNILLFNLLFLITISCFVESVLEVMAGIVFFVFFVLLLSCVDIKEETN